MKQKIEITQADMLDLLAEKIKFLSEEYKKLYEAYEYKGKGRTKADPLKITESHTRFLREEGDINRILDMFDMFDEEGKKEKQTANE